MFFDRVARHDILPQTQKQPKTLSLSFPHELARSVTGAFIPGRVAWPIIQQVILFPKKIFNL